jgi:galactokinase
MVEAKLEGVLRKRARHVVTEDDRVLETVRRLSRGDPIGDLLYASHESLRADFEVSSPELDCVVEVAAANGAAGARLTGAGFGGCALVVADRRDAIFAEVKKKFQARGFVEPRSFEVTAAAGASALTV